MKHGPIFGLFLLSVALSTSACSGPGEGISAPETTSVQVNEFDYKIVSPIVTFTPGKPYHFEVKNAGNKAHEFMIMPKSAGNMKGMSMKDMDKMALARLDNIAPGQTATLDFTFPSSGPESQLEFACHYPGHYEAGMKQDISVTS
jgi:uncharacterized cupredoxin-like copper-binding protein